MSLSPQGRSQPVIETSCAVAQRAGGTLGYWRVAIKPGRPIAVGTLGQAVWIGLPGNPVAALVTLLLIALPALRMANGSRPPPPMTANGFN